MFLPIPPINDETNFYVKVGTYIASWALICATIGYVATHIFTNYNPISGAILIGSQFFLSTVCGYSLRKIGLRNKTQRPSRMELAAIDIAILFSILAATITIPYVGRGISFVASCLPSVSFIHN